MVVASILGGQNDRHRDDPIASLLKAKLNTSWWWLPIGAAALYLLMAFLLGFKTIGLQYDESLNQHGAVHLLTSTEKPSFAYHRGSWIPLFGRYWPLMIIPYAGAVKHYVLVLPFAIFGTDAAVGRFASALLGAIGIWGIARFLQGEIGLRAAAAVAGILAIHPAYLIHTVYDNGTVVTWMAIVGLLAIAVRRYKEQGTAFSALAIGFLMGIGIWNRANFVWMLASIILACAIVYRRKLCIPFAHLAAMTAGGVVGVAPLLVFQVLSRWEILRSMEVAQAGQSLTSLLAWRLGLLADTLLITNENRGIWGGPPLPLWQTLFLSVTLILSLLICFLVRGRGEHAGSNLNAFRRASALGFLFFALLMLTSRLRIASHHLVMLVPIAIIISVIALQVLLSRSNKAWLLVGAVALIYVGSALNWDLTAARGFRETGGLGSWSDAIYSVNDYLEAHYDGREVKILDWGLKNNLYVLSYGKLTGPEIFSNATRDNMKAGTSWDAVVSEGGVFLTNSAGNLNFPVATEGFLAALTRSGYEFRRIEFRQKNGAPYAEILDVPAQ